jgi:hypothetical protein
MDSEEKRGIKKLGKKLVEQRSQDLKERLPAYALLSLR